MKLPHLPQVLSLAWIPLLFCSVHQQCAADAPPQQSDSQSLVWLDDYGTAYTQALAAKKMLLVYFVAEPQQAANKAFEEVTLQDDQVQRLMSDYVLLRVPTTTEVLVNGKPMQLLKHGAFAHMRCKQGLAVIDLAHDDQPYYKDTVSCLPFEKPAYYAPQYHSAKSLRVLLSLPSGSLTQRTLVYAVRCHPERPQSASGRADEVLMSATASHSAHQARIATLGHHNWESRFQRLYAKLGGQPPSEVCAQSWQGESLVTGCFSAVDSWRHSPGHWSAVSAVQPAYGYDIRRGRDGNWYATGIFGGKRSS